jgi:hypothetical protein
MRSPINLSDVHRAHGMVVSRTGLAVQKRAHDAGKFAQNYVQVHPTFKPQTGNLQRKTGYKVAVRRGGKTLFISNSAKYAGAIDQGARPHVIRPRKAKALRFVVGGKVVFARKVNHPGNKPFKFLYRAATAAGRTWHQGIQADMASIAKAF